LFGAKASRSADQAKRLLVTSYFEQARTALLDGRQAEAIEYLRHAHDGGLDNAALHLMYDYAEPSVGSELARLDGHGGKVWEIAYSPDGKLLYSAHEDGAVRVWDAVAHRLLATWKGHTADVRKLEISRDGRRIATAGDDGTVRVWDTATGRTISQYAGESGPLYCLCMDADRGVVVTAGLRYLRIGDMDSGTTLHEVHFNGLAHECALDPGGRWVVLADRLANKASIWDLRTGEQVLELAEGSPVVDAEPSPDGRMLATASADGTVRLWSLPEGHLLHEMPGHADIVDRVEFSADGKQLASTSRDFTVKIWAPATGALIYTLRGHRSLIYRSRFDAQGDHLVTTGQDGTARLWDMHTGRLVADLVGSEAPMFRARFSPDGSTLAGASWDGTIVLWPTRDPFEVASVAGDDRTCADEAKADEDLVIVSCEHMTRVFDLRASRITDLPPSVTSAIARDRVHVVTASGSVVTSWDLATKQARQHVDVGADVNAMRWSPGGDIVAIGTAKGDVVLWWPERGDISIVRFDHHDGTVTALAWSSAGLLVTGDLGGVVHLSTPPAAVTADRRFVLGAPISRIAFSQDAALLAVAAGASIEVHDAPAGRLISRMQSQAGITNFSFDASGDRLFGGSLDGVGRLWQTRDGALITRLLGASVIVVSPTFVGNSLSAATGRDGIVRFWDLDSGKQIVTLQGGMGAGLYVLRPRVGQISMITENAALLTWHLHEQNGL
jgi:WD40 repeat protein